jgi:C4-dicarboxylate transporter DctM subunit
MPIDPVILLTIGSIILFLVGIPILLVFGMWAVGFYLLSGIPLSNMSIVAYEQLNTFAFAAIPLFILLGSLLDQLGVSTKIVNWANSWGGWLPGSTANTAIYSAGVFSAITGSNSATTAAVGEALMDDLDREGYDRTFAAATIAAGGTLGIIIPPSVLFIIYGITFNVSVTELFLAGTIPGILMMLSLSAMASYISYKRNYGDGSKFSFDGKRVLRTTWEAKTAIGVIVVLLGGIYAGIFTPSESAVVALLYLVLVGLWTRELNSFDQLLHSFTTVTTLIGIIVPVFVTSFMVQQGLSFLGLQSAVANAVLALTNPWIIGLVMVIILLISGSVLASVPNMILTAPLLAPVAFHLGLSPLMWGVVFMISDAIGFITPPYGLNLYIISSITELDYIKVAYAALPYLVVLTIIMVVFIVFPELNVLA